MKIDESNYIELLYLKNEKALIYVIDTYGGLIKSVIKRHLGSIGSSQDIEECMNDVFMGIWNNIRYFDPDKSSFKNWAAGVARYKALDYLRKVSLYQSRNQQIESDAGYKDTGIENIAENQLSKELNDLLLCLKPEDRELFRKIYVEEIPIDIISKETGVKRETIYSRLSRGRKKLKKIDGSAERSK